MNKKMEFSKKITIFAAVLMFIAFLLSVILAFFEKDPIETITGTIITVCGGEILSYYIKSAAEKNSRNKYRVAEDGTPYDYEFMEGGDSE